MWQGMIKIFFISFLCAQCALGSADRWSFIGTWNPHSLVTAYRLDEVSTVLRNVGMIAYPGTGARAWQGEAHHAARAAFHHTIHFGWERSRLVTKACGCAVMLNKTWFAKKDIRRIIAAPEGLRGRGGVVYVSSGTVMIAMMVLYFPPKPSKEGSSLAYRHTCEKLLMWAKGEYLRIPQRYTPVICMDLNSGLRARPDSEAVGPFGADGENKCGQAVHEWLDLVGLVAINTFYDCGNTFEGSAGSSQIDYMCVPSSALPLVEWTKTWRRSAQEGRSMPAVLDHIPVVMKMRMVPPIVLTPMNARWDRAKLSQATLTGDGREEFLKDIQYELETHREAFEIYESRDVTTGHSALLMEMIKRAGLRHFSQQPPRNEKLEKMNDEKWKLLKARRSILNGISAADVANNTDHGTVAAEHTVSIKAYTKTIKAHRRLAIEKKKEITELELSEAWRKRDMASVPRLSRALAGTGIGIKNRNYRANPSFSPSAAEWIQFLELPALRGGLAGEATTAPWCAAVTDERYQQLLDISEYAHPDNYDVPKEMKKSAQKDFKYAVKAIRRSKLGRYAPAWSAPAEIYKMLLNPTWINSPSEYWKRPMGIGARPVAIMSEEPNSPDPYDKNQLQHLGKYGEAAYRMFRLTVHVRRTESLPLQASLSYGFAPDKKNGKPGPAGRRLLHALCPWWRAYTRGQLLQGGTFRPPSWAFACRGRRREHLMMATKIVAWKGVHSGQPMLHKSYDATNAFACGSKDQLEQCVYDRLVEGTADDEEDDGNDIQFAAHITRSRRAALTVIIDAADERLAVKSGSGGFMGDTSEPEIFMQNYHHSVTAWATFEKRQNNGSTVINFGRFGPVDASMGAFMDDIFKMLLIPKDLIDAKEIVKLSKKNDYFLDQSLAAREYGQNRSKQDVVPALRARQLNKQVIVELKNSGCQAGYQLKHLGGWFNAVGSNANELKARIQALNRGWLMVKGFWYTQAPMRVKRLMFISLVSGAGLSGTIAMVWTVQEHRTICSSLVKKLRSLMGGAATFTEEQVRSLTSREVYRYWKLVPFALEATVQRIKAWQSVIRNPANHAHFLSVFFGVMKWENEAEHATPCSITPAGDINDNPGVHPWLAQFKRDVKIVMDHPEAEDFACAWSGDIHELLWDTDVNCYFLAFDPRSLRTAFTASVWRPPASLADAVPAERDDENTWENPLPSFACTIVGGDGTSCGAVFRTRAALIAHVTQSQGEGHGGRSIFHIITPTNECINCGTTFQNRTEAVRHIARSWHSGRCIRNNTAYPYPLKDPKDLICTVCGLGFSSYPSLRTHLGSHLPPTAAGPPVAVTEPRPPRQPAAPRGRPHAPPGLAVPPRARGNERRTVPGLVVERQRLRQPDQPDDGGGGDAGGEGPVARPRGLISSLHDWWERLQERRRPQEAEGQRRRRSRSRSCRQRRLRGEGETSTTWRSAAQRQGRQGQEADDEGQRAEGAAAAASHPGDPAHTAQSRHVGDDDQDCHPGRLEPDREGHAGREQDVRGGSSGAEGQAQAPQGPGEGGQGRQGGRGEGQRRGGQRLAGAARAGTSYDDGVRGHGRSTYGRGGRPRQQNDARGLVHGHGRRPSRLRQTLPLGELLPAGHDQDCFQRRRPGKRECAVRLVQGPGPVRRAGLGTSRVHGRGALGVDRRFEGVKAGPRRLSVLSKLYQCGCWQLRTVPR